MPDDARLGIGGNSPPEPIIDPINDPSPPAQSVLERWLCAFKAALEIRNEALIARYAELERGIARVPTLIESASDAARVTDFIAQVEGHIKAGDAAHKAEKAFFFRASKIIDACLLHRGRALAERLGPVRRCLSVYYEALAREERLRRAAERRAGAADPIAPIAESSRQRKPAPPETMKIRGDYGAVAYAQTRWEFEIVDLDAVPREYMSLDYPGVRDAINRDGVREIPGLKIRAVEHLVVKGT